MPYSINTLASANLAAEIVTLVFHNTGAQAAVFQVRSANLLQAPRSYTVSPNSKLTDTWEFAGDDPAAYDLSVYGPNGFFRHYRGGVSESIASNLESEVVYDIAGNGVTVISRNVGTRPAAVTLENVYSGTTTAHLLVPGALFETFVPLARSAGWYDFVLTVGADGVFQQQLAGHLETGKASTTDPAIS